MTWYKHDPSRDSRLGCPCEGEAERSYQESQGKKLCSTRLVRGRKTNNPLRIHPILPPHPNPRILHRSTRFFLTGFSMMYAIFASRDSEDRRTRSNDSVCHTCPVRPNSRLINCAEAPLIAPIISASE